MLEKRPLRHVTEPEIEPCALLRSERYEAAQGKGRHCRMEDVDVSGIRLAHARDIERHACSKFRGAQGGRVVRIDNGIGHAWGP